MKAVIMAGGQGQRLRPLTCTVPKPMLPIANRPVIEYAVELLKKHGVHEIAVTLQYQPQMITSHLGNGGGMDVSFEYFTEATPLGTAGSVKNAEDYLSDEFIVLSGDGLTDIDLTKAIEFHRQNSADVTVVLKRVEDPLEYGVVITDENGRILRFAEKPTWSEVFSDTVNTGIYIINKSVLSLMEQGKEYDFSKDLFPMMMEKKMEIFGFVAEGYWCDVGNLRSYLKANEDVLLGNVDVIKPMGYTEVSKGVFVGENVTLHKDASLVAPCMVGHNSVIGKNAVVSEGTVIGDGCVLGDNTTAKRSVISSNVTVGNGCQMRGAMIAPDCVLDDGVSVFECSAVGEGTRLGQGTTVKGGASVWPQKTVEGGCTSSSNVIWQTVKYSGFFDRECIRGKLNSQLSVQNAVVASAAFASMGKKRILFADSGTQQSEMLTLAAKSGALSTGAKVIDMGAAPLPALRYAIRLIGADGGIYLGVNDGVAQIYFINEAGANISSAQERKIESALNNNTTPVAESASIQSAQDFEKGNDFYESHLIALCDELKDKCSDVSVTVINDHSVHTALMVNVLVRLGIKTEIKEQDEITPPIEGLVVGLFDFGEGLVIYNEDMTPLDNARRSLLMNYLLLRLQRDDKYVVADYNAPDELEEMARSKNGRVIRTNTGVRALIDQIIKHDGIKDSIPVGKMSLYYDGILFLRELLSCMADEKKSIKELIESLPQLHLSQDEVACPWDKRCGVMRRLAENESVSSGNGVRISGRYGWSVVLPDEKRAVFKIYTEAYSNEYARELTESCIDKINKLLEE